MVVPAQFTVGLVTVHIYGLLLGLAAVVVIQLIRYLIPRNLLSDKQFNWYVLAASIGAIVGARMWHIGTDWQLYRNQHLSKIFATWSGGMSIFGAVAGVLIAVIMVRYLLQRIVKRPQPSLIFLFDVITYALPVGQIIGRVGNYVNQELYGLPTTLPWGMYIEPVKRLESVRTSSQFHPLFLYEMIAMAAVSIFFWLKQTEKLGVSWKLGSGKFVATYILYYSGARFLLDFLRIDATKSGVWVLSINQLIVMGVFIVSGVVIIGKRSNLLWRSRRAK